MDGEEGAPLCSDGGGGEENTTRVVSTVSMSKPGGVLQISKEDSKEGESSAKQPSRGAVKSQGCQATEAILAADAFLKQVTSNGLTRDVFSSTIGAQKRSHSVDDIKPVKKEPSVGNGWCAPPPPEPGTSSATADFHSAKISLSGKQSEPEDFLRLHTQGAPDVKAVLLCDESSPMEESAPAVGSQHASQEGVDAKISLPAPAWGGQHRDAGQAKQGGRKEGTKKGPKTSKVSRAWTEKEDTILLLHVAAHGEQHWRKASVRLQVISPPS